MALKIKKKDKKMVELAIVDVECEHAVAPPSGIGLCKELNVELIN